MRPSPRRAGLRRRRGRRDQGGSDGEEVETDEDARSRARRRPRSSRCRPQRILEVDDDEPAWSRGLRHSTASGAGDAEKAPPHGGQSRQGGYARRPTTTRSPNRARRTKAWATSSGTKRSPRRLRQARKRSPKLTASADSVRAYTASRSAPMSRCSTREEEVRARQAHPAEVEASTPRWLMTVEMAGKGEKLHRRAAPADMSWICRDGDRAKNHLLRATSPGGFASRATRAAAWRSST